MNAGFDKAKRAPSKYEFLLDVVAHTSNHSPSEMEAGESGVRVHALLGY